MPYAHRLSKRAAPRWYRQMVARTVRAPAPTGAYSLNFTALGANEAPLSQGGIWTNNTQGTGGNAAMTTQTSMQVRLSADGSTRICCEDDGPHVNYEDSFAVVPGFAGSQRVTAVVYKESGYSPSENHEMEVFLGAVVYGSNNKRAVEILVSAAGAWALVLHDGAMSGATFTVINSAEVSNGVPADGDVVVAEFDRSAKTIKAWSNGTLRISTQWATTHDEIDASVQSKLNALGDGAGLAGLRRNVGSTGTAVEGKFGWRSIEISPTLQGAG